MEMLAQTVRKIAGRLVVAGELLQCLWDQRLWWLIPMVTVLLLFGLLMFFVQATPVGSFVYTLF
jgi:hypothetical protein